MVLSYELDNIKALKNGIAGYINNCKCVPYHGNERFPIYQISYKLTKDWTENERTK